MRYVLARNRDGVNHQSEQPPQDEFERDGSDQEHAVEGIGVEGYDGADGGSHGNDERYNDCEHNIHLAFVDAFLCFVVRQFEILQPEAFPKDIKQICESFGFPVTIRRSSYFGGKRC